MVGPDSGTLDRLGFRHWPFDLTPDLRGEIVWADRGELRAAIDRMLRKLSKMPSNSLHLLWADFGAGKTHTLLYMRQRLREDRSTRSFPVYCSLPKQARHFPDIYKAIARAIPSEQIQGAFRDVESAKGHDWLRRRMTQIWPSMWNALNSLSSGPEPFQETAYGWLRCEERLPAAQLARIGVTDRIRTTDDALLALQAMIDLFIFAGHRRVYLLIDEFQRIGELRGKVQDEINAGLHGLFNSAGPGVSLVLSFSFGVEENIRLFLNKELLSRADPERISLPTMDLHQSVEFVAGMTRIANGGDELPSHLEAVSRRIAETIFKAGTPTPRRLVKAASIVYSEAALDIEDQKISRPSPEYVSRILGPDVVGRIMSDGEDGPQQ